MQTGKKEAKLLEDDHPTSPELPSSALISTGVEEPEEVKETTLDHAELEKALKKIKNEAKDVEKETSFRSYEEIKEEMKDLEMNIETEYEILKKLVAGYPTLEDDAAKLVSLHDLEFYVHQYDNALDFIKMGGFKNIVMPALNSSNFEVRSAAAFMFGNDLSF